MELQARGLLEVNKKSQDAVKKTGDLALAIAEQARETIGPNGTVLQIPEEDAALSRVMFVTRLAEAAMMILDGKVPEQ